MGNKVKVNELKPGDSFDATPLVECLLEQISADDIPELREFAESARAAAECVFFEVESVERSVYGERYVVYAHPFNLPAREGMTVELREW